MDIKLKQRVVGAMVFIALAIIFLPSLFHKDERVIVDTSSLIPPKPSVAPIVITAPIKLDGVKPAPAPDLAFQPPVEPALAEKVEPKTAATQSSVAKTNTPDSQSKSQSAEKAVAKPTVKPTITKAKQKAAEKKAAEKKATPKPSLNKQGIPNAWVVQVASLRSKKSADDLTKKLRNSQYKAYFRTITTPKGTFFRVFVGPYIDKSRAIRAKVKLDKAYSVDSRVLTFSPE